MRAHRFVLLAILLLPLRVQAQPREGRSIDVALGAAYSIQTAGGDGSGSGLLVKAEYVFGWYSFLGARVYAGSLLTWPEDPDHSEDERCALSGVRCDVSAKIGVLGAKMRFAAPIPWIAPFFDVGLGVSHGFLETHGPDGDTDVHGLAVHIPFALGLAVGSDHSVELALVFYSHPRADQMNGGATLGVSIPLSAPL